MTRRQREVSASEQHAAAALKWCAAAAAAGCALKLEGVEANATSVAFRAAFNEAAEGVRNHALRESLRHAAHALALKAGPSPKRVRSRRARRVRMARKRRRGWA